MKKHFLTVCTLMICTMFVACGKAGYRSSAEEPQSTDVSAGGMEDSYSDADRSGDASQSPEADHSAESGADSEAGRSSESAGAETSKDKDLSSKSMKDSRLQDTEKEVEEISGEEESVTLSDKILKAGDTMTDLFPLDDDPQNQGLVITLKEAKFYETPEDAGLDRLQMEEQTENFDISGNPEWCGIGEGKLLVCDLNVKNINHDREDELHISEIMIAYADPDTRKVGIVSCAPAYLSASSSKVGAPDYYHYQLPKGESKEMKVAWLIQESYEPENLYLCVTYDVKEPGERQYFKLTGE